MGRCGTKPSAEGWHILRAFWKLSSKVRPMAMTCKGEHTHMRDSEASLALSDTVGTITATKTGTERDGSLGTPP